MAAVTSERAFQEPIFFSSKSGRAQIDQPAWVERVDTAYLSLWIAALLEENLWAHFNFAHSTNMDKHLRKTELASLFETQAETLQSQEVLAKHWQDIGHKGRNRLIEKLRQKAKGIQIVPSETAYPFGAEQYFAFEQAYQSDLGSAAFSKDEAARFYAS